MKHRRIKYIKHVIGIDEVGRGPLAGPVTVVALSLPRNFQFTSRYKQDNLQKLRDSKKLSRKQREEWFKFIKKNFKYAIANISPNVIDKINVTQAANLAATRALKRLISNYKFPISKTAIFLDGGLNILTEKFKIKNLKFKIVIKGDEKIPAIALASIVAKVTRDRKMELLHKKYPRYNFDQHKGYGTKKHFKALKKYGYCKIHRLTFVPKNICRKKY